MSAFYSIPYNDRVEILTDGAYYRDDGTLTRTGEKIWRLGGLSAAITGRGDSDGVGRAAAFINALSKGRGFDDTMSALADALVALAGNVLPVDRQFEMLIAGISERHGPLHYFWTTSPVYPGVAPLTLQHVPGDIGGGAALTPAELSPLRLGRKRVAAGMSAWGADFMEIMRRKQMPNPTKPDLPPLYGIGGHVDLTVVRADGVTTTRLRTWPDVVGEKIDPFRAERAAA